MPRISTRVDVHSQEFQDNERAMRSLVEDLRREAARAARGGSRAATDKHKAAGKPHCARAHPRAARHRQLPSWSSRQLAAHGMYGGEIACAGVVTGIGRIGGRECVVVANDPHRQGRHLLSGHGEEAPARQESRATTACRCVYLVESGGGFSAGAG